MRYGPESFVARWGVDAAFVRYEQHLFPGELIFMARPKKNDTKPTANLPLQAGLRMDLAPRALPWAFTVRPVGALNHLAATQLNRLATQ